MNEKGGHHLIASLNILLIHDKEKDYGEFVFSRYFLYLCMCFALNKLAVKDCGVNGFEAL